MHEWILPRGEQASSPSPGYMVSFTVFHEWGFSSLPHDFLRELLHYYKVELHHLNPSSIQHMAAFMALCEGYLGIKPHFNLWRYFFKVEMHKNRIGSSSSPVYSVAAMGSASICL